MSTNYIDIFLQDLEAVISQVVLPEHIVDLLKQLNNDIKNGLWSSADTVIMPIRSDVEDPTVLRGYSALLAKRFDDCVGGGYGYVLDGNVKANLRGLSQHPAIYSVVCQEKNYYRLGAFGTSKICDDNLNLKTTHNIIGELKTQNVTPIYRSTAFGGSGIAYFPFRKVRNFFMTHSVLISSYFLSRVIIDADA